MTELIELMHTYTRPDRSRSAPTRTARLLAVLGSVAFSRHAAIPMLRRVGASPVGHLPRRVAGLLLGSSLIGISVALLVHAGLGLPPYDVLSSALSDLLGLSLGQAGWLVAAALFCVAGLFGQWPSGWGLVFIISNGLMVDAASGLLTRPDTLFGRWIFVIAAIVIMASGISLVVYSGTTGGPFELLMIAGELRGASPVVVRTGLDLGVFGLGVVLGGSFGLATVIYALVFGITMRTIGQALTDHDAGRRARLEAAAAEPAEPAGPAAATAAEPPRDSSRRGARQKVLEAV